MKPVDNRFGFMLTQVNLEILVT